MKKLLLSAPTDLEMAPLRAALDRRSPQISVDYWELGGNLIRVVVTGAGVPCVCTHLTRALYAFQPDLLVHLGVAGAREGVFEPPQVVEVVSDQFGDIGAEEQDGRLSTMFDLGLWQPDSGLWSGGSMHNPHRWSVPELPGAKGMTVNTIPGIHISQGRLSNRFDFDVESMEGAAVFYAAMTAGVRFHCLRGISNLIEPRDKSRWDIAGAVESVSAVAMQGIEAYLF